MEIFFIDIYKLNGKFKPKEVILSLFLFIFGIFFCFFIRLQGWSQERPAGHICHSPRDFLGSSKHLKLFKSCRLGTATAFFMEGQIKFGAK